MSEIEDQAAVMMDIRSSHQLLHPKPIENCPVCTLLGFNDKSVEGRPLESYRFIILDASDEQL